MHPPYDLWVFGYGSLMWRPGFAYEEAQHARLTGYRRCFCIYSVHHRGSPERPGLVLGLDRGGTCEGIAYRIAASRAALKERFGFLKRQHIKSDLICYFAPIREPRRDQHARPSGWQKVYYGIWRGDIVVNQ